VIRADEPHAASGEYSAPDRAGIYLLQVTDTHFASDPNAELDGVNPRASLATVLAHIRVHEHGVDAILATGDLAHDASPQAYVALRDALQRLETPVLCLAGNHDDAQVMQDYLTGGWVTRAPTATFGNWQIICMDTEVPGREGGELGPARRARLAEMLDGGTAEHILLALHHPPVAIGSPWMDAMGLSDARAVLGLLDRCSRLRGIVWGHVHQQFERRRGGVSLMASPSTCIQFAPGATRYTKHDAPPGYRRLRLQADGAIHSEVVRVAFAPG
jgi:Icc protein